MSRCIAFATPTCTGCPATSFRQGRHVVMDETSACCSKETLGQRDGNRKLQTGSRCKMWFFCHHRMKLKDGDECRRQRRRTCGLRTDRQGPRRQLPGNASDLHDQGPAQQISSCSTEPAQHRQTQGHVNDTRATRYSTIVFTVHIIPCPTYTPAGPPSPRPPPTQRNGTKNTRTDMLSEEGSGKAM